MKMILIAAGVFTISLIFSAGCSSGKLGASVASTEWHPWTNEVTTSKQLGTALKARWSLDSIRAYCNATPPTPDSFQNLVVMGEEWKGPLYDARPSEFDGISWYASARNGKLDEYSVNANKGRKHWIIEIGNAQTLSAPPVLSRVAASATKNSGM